MTHGLENTRPPCPLQTPRVYSNSCPASDAIQPSHPLSAEAEDRISEVEDRKVEINDAERKKEKRIERNEDNLRDLWDNVKRPNIQIIGVPEEEDKKKGHEKIL